MFEAKSRLENSRCKNASLHLAPTNFHLFRSLLNLVLEILLNTDAELKAWLDDFFQSKSGEFYQRGVPEGETAWKLFIHLGNYEVLQRDMELYGESCVNI